MDVSQRWALVGPGAIGLYYGGLLAKSGICMQLLGRSDYEVLKANGITLRMMAADTENSCVEYSIIPETVERKAQAISAVDCVLIAAKSTANPDFLPELSRLVTPGSTVLLTLQNGMGNVEFLAKHFPKNPILAGLCFVCVNRVAPAIVENYLPGRVEFGSLDDRYPDAADWAVSVFTRAGVKCRRIATLDAATWRKLCWNVPFNGLSITAGGVTTDRILADAGLVSRARLLMHELQRAAALAGHTIEDTFLQGQFAATKKMGAYHPSSMIDFLEGRAVEVEAIFGEPLRRGRALGLEMPELEKLYNEIVNLTR